MFLSVRQSEIENWEMVHIAMTMLMILSIISFYQGLSIVFVSLPSSLPSYLIISYPAGFQRKT